MMSLDERKALCQERHKKSYCQRIGLKRFFMTQGIQESPLIMMCFRPWYIRTPSSFKIVFSATQTVQEEPLLRGFAVNV